MGRLLAFRVNLRAKASQGLGSLDSQVAGEFAAFAEVGSMARFVRDHRCARPKKQLADQKV